MKVIIAIDSFKGSLLSIEASNAISKGIKDVYQNAEIIAFPLADGGEGTVDALVCSADGQFIEVNVTGPLGEKVNATYGILGDGRTAVIEVAQACGLPLISDEQRNPLLTTTYGVGEMILDAIEKGCTEFIIGLGGSATNDAGIGMLQALGYRFLDDENIDVGFGGGVLANIINIETSLAHPLLEGCSFKLACDVTNLLHGEEGAAYIFGPQKGASKSVVKILDTGLKHFSSVVYKELDKDIHNVKGAGAAGGLGAAFFGFLNAKLESGIDIILNLINLEGNLDNVDFVITGEGKLDSQTAMGKVPAGVANLAKQYNIPVIALAGAITDEYAKLNELGITSYFSILNQPMPVEDAMNAETAYNNMQKTTTQLFRLIRSIR